MGEEYEDMIAVGGWFGTFRFAVIGRGYDHIVESRIFQTLLSIADRERLINIDDKSRCRFEVLFPTVAVILPFLLFGIDFSGYEAVIVHGENFL